MNDDYGRSNKRYEGKKYFKSFDKNTMFLNFKNKYYKLNKKYLFKRNKKK